MTDEDIGTAEALAPLRHLAALGALSIRDVELASMVARRTQTTAPEILLAVAALSAAMGEGASCVRLSERARRPLLASDGRVLLAPSDGTLGTDTAAAPIGRWPEPESWREALSRWIAERPRPGLVLSGERLAFERFAALEARVARSLSQRAAELGDGTDGRPAQPSTAAVVSALPPRVAGPQQHALVTAALRGLCVMTGGPGTGKTTTIAHMLDTLQRLGAWSDPARVRLLAPTGKAAARMVESLEQTWTERIAAAPEAGRRDPVLGTRFGAMTIHKALSVRPGGGPRYGVDEPLPVDLVIVDEVSMVDLQLMGWLLDALPRRARLVLVGDPNQLSSVDVGTVLRDVRDAGRAAVSTPWLDRIASICGGLAIQEARASRPTSDAPVFGDACVELTHTWRFGSTIRALAESSLRAGDPSPGTVDVPDVLALLRGTVEPRSVLRALGLGDATHDLEGGPGTIEWIELAEDQSDALPPAVLSTLAEAMAPAVRAAFAEGTNAARAAAALTERDAVRALCAVRRGPFGVAGLNTELPRRLHSRLGNALGPAFDAALRPEPGLYPGLPVLVVRNDYEAELMNGDLGVGVVHRAEPAVAAAASSDAASPDPARDRDEVRAWFVAPGEEGLAPDAPRRARPFGAAALPDWEPAWALTIHKSQGSQFEHVVVILPPDPSHALLSRELFYTAATRAKARVTVVATEAALVAALRGRVQRVSGLGELLGD